MHAAGEEQPGLTCRLSRPLCWQQSDYVQVSLLHGYSQQGPLDVPDLPGAPKKPCWTHGDVHKDENRRKGTPADSCRKAHQEGDVCLAAISIPNLKAALARLQHK